jgi:hypothetical protein
MLRRLLWILDNALTIQGAIRFIKERQDGEAGHETLQLFVRRSDGNKRVQVRDGANLEGIGDSRHGIRLLFEHTDFKVRTINFKEHVHGSRANEASDSNKSGNKAVKINTGVTKRRN